MNKIELNQTNPTVPRSSGIQSLAKLGRIVGALAVIIVVAFLVGLIPRWHQSAAVESETRELAIVTVSVVSPAPNENSAGLSVPAEIKPWIEIPIYSRAYGYLKVLKVDIGSQVAAGQVLAELETPELDQEFEQARHQLAQSQAALTLAKVMAERSAKLLASNAIPIEEDEQRQADLAIKTANVQADSANVGRLEDLKSFARITAPFAGTITARNTDVGDLIRSSDATELFRLSQIDRMRVYAQVPQSIAQGVAPGQQAELLISQMPGRVFTTKIVRSAGRLSEDSRTLLVEMELDSTQGEILAGSFAQVRFKSGKSNALLSLPSSTLLFGTVGPQVAVVQADNKVEMRVVKLGRDYGKTVEILSGVGPTDRVILNPSDALVSGTAVRIVDTAKLEKDKQNSQ
jgi:RND family efflux transporter MFP subunit